MLIFHAILRIIRVDSSVLAFLVIFIPLQARTRNIASSFGMAIPLFFTFVCTFIANDLDDIERDRVNHPERPLPAGHLTPEVATVLYFASLAASLFSTRYFVIEGSVAFLYYALITLSISYGYIVERFPGLKAPYVAAVSSIPIFIVAALFPNEITLYFVAISVFLLFLGREICMDIKDRPGDATSFMHKLRATPLAIAAFCLQFMGLCFLTSRVRTPIDVVVLLGTTFLLGIAGICWFKFMRLRLAIILMKIQFFAGLYFLI